ncbi:MAG TPA: nuclear transport factor 2 family protein [Steroidobacteraceae bacterium]|jgi:hypothetical protein
MKRRITAVITMFCMLMGLASGADLTAEQNAASKHMIELERGWVEQGCGGKWVISEMLASDFWGTAPKGTRYGKPSGEPTYDPKTQWATDCRLDDTEVRFFGADVAVMYGAESKTVALPDSKHERRCLVWTDTWIKRNGKWQVIAVQDNRVDCPAK